MRSFFHRPTACSGRVMLKALGRFPTKTFNERGFPSLLYVIPGGQCNHEIAWVLTISSALILWGRWAGGLINVSTLGSVYVYIYIYFYIYIYIIYIYIYICKYYRRSMFEGQLCSFDDTYIHIITYVYIYIHMYKMYIYIYTFNIHLYNN